MVGVLEGYWVERLSWKEMRKVYKHGSGKLRVYWSNITVGEM